MATSSGYQVGGSSSVGTTGVSNEPETKKSKKDYWPLQRLKRAYLDYLGNKREEIDEQIEARRYRHGAHWTEAQIAALNKRKQPIVTYNRIGRKIDGIVGLVEKLRQDPKAFPRTPQHEQGAELATAVVRYVLDENQWGSKSPICAENGAVDGIGGIELELAPADTAGDMDVSFEVVDIEGFFYDPKSYRADFSDARYMGMGKWVDVETALELFPDKEDEIRDSVGSGTDLTTEGDKDNKWFSESASGDRKFIRLVDCWYRHDNSWCWALFTGTIKLMEGESYFLDQKNKTTCKFVMYSAFVDHDGDRYGFVRNLRSANDEINQRRSKGLHELNSRRIIAEEGAFPDIEKARVEAARPDGIVLRNPNTQAEFDDTARIANIEGQLKFLEDAKAEIENFGPNPALIGTGVEAKSGRAIALMQQAGIAELGPFILGYKGWKIRVYKAIWNAVQRHWSAERWIRVTDDEQIAHFVQINGLQADPMTGIPQMVNQLGNLDVDIIMDEGPDNVNMQADAYDTLTVLAGQGVEIPPLVLLELSPLPASKKKQLKDMMTQPDPAKEKAKEIALAGEAAKVKETESKTVLNFAKAQQEMQDETAKMHAEIQLAQQELLLEREKHGMEMRHKHEEHRMNIAHDAQKFQMDAQVKMAQAQQQTQQRQQEFADKSEERKMAMEMKRADQLARDKERVSQDDSRIKDLESRVKEIGRRRRVTLNRDPKSGKTIGAEIEG